MGGNGERLVKGLGSPLGWWEDNVGNVLSVTELFKMVNFLLCGSHPNIKELKNKNGDTKKGGVAPPESGLAGSENQGCPRGGLTSIRVCHSSPAEHAMIQAGQTSTNCVLKGVRGPHVSVLSRSHPRAGGAEATCSVLAPRALLSGDDSLAVRQSEPSLVMFWGPGHVPAAPEHRRDLRDPVKWVEKWTGGEKLEAAGVNDLLRARLWRTGGVSVDISPAQP